MRLTAVFSLRRLKSVSDRGLTLVELIITVWILMVAGYLLMVILFQNNTIFQKQSSKVTQGLSLNNTSLQVNEDIKSASSVIAVSPTTPSYSSGLTTLVLAIPSIDATGNPIPNSSDYIVITPDNNSNNVLRRITFPTPPSVRQSQNKVLVTNLASIKFYYLDVSGNTTPPANAANVNYNLTVFDQNGSVPLQSNTSNQVRLRNK